MHVIANLSIDIEHHACVYVIIFVVVLCAKQVVLSFANDLRSSTGPVLFGACSVPVVYV